MNNTIMKINAKTPRRKDAEKIENALAAYQKLKLKNGSVDRITLRLARLCVNFHNRCISKEV